MSAEISNRLGTFLRDRRTRLDPAAFGFATGRRRTPGLRREEIAQRANISATWYTWLEQGRGGAPSADVLDRLAAGLMLTEPEREHLFILGLGRPPEVRYKPVSGVSSRLQRVLDAFEISPAMIKTATWDVVAWNRAAAALLIDYAALPPSERNILRMMFSNARVRAAQEDWRSVARYVVGAFRADALRAGRVRGDRAARRGAFPVEPGIRGHVARQTTSARAAKASNACTIRNSGRLSWNSPRSPWTGRPELGMVVYNPATQADADRIRSFLASRQSDG